MVCPALVDRRDSSVSYISTSVLSLASFLASLLRSKDWKRRNGSAVRVSDVPVEAQRWRIYSWIGDEVVLYTLGNIKVGNHTVISQRSYLCAGSHKIEDVQFTITSQPIEIGDQCWIATDVFVCPGVKIGFGTVVGARSTVTSDLPPGVIAYGSPAKPAKTRPPSAATQI